MAIYMNNFESNDNFENHKTGCLESKFSSVDPIEDLRSLVAQQRSSKSGQETNVGLPALEIFGDKVQSNIESPRDQVLSASMAIPGEIEPVEPVIAELTGATQIVMPNCYQHLQMVRSRIDKTVRPPRIEAAQTALPPNTVSDLMAASGITMPPMVTDQSGNSQEGSGQVPGRLDLEKRILQNDPA